MAVARFDRRNMRERFVLGSDDDVPFDAQVEDAMKVVEELERDPRIDRTRIGLWGYSQGAWVAPLAASRSTKVAFLVLLASTGVSPSEQMLYGTVKQARLAGFGDEATRHIVAVRQVVDEHRRGRATLAEAQRAVDSIKNEPFFAHAWTPPDLRGIDLTWRDMDFDPEPIFAGVRVPTLLFYGEDDEWSPIDASVAAWKRSAERAGNNNVTVVRLAGTKHAPTLGGGDDDPISPEYERTMVDWLDQITRAGSSSPR
ncbi:MAG: alpha/beta hydrolase [Chloroflexota bacterium]|nr:alpha/beta hydrolase [Chloroflexota bacterium]